MPQLLIWILTVHVLGFATFPFVSRIVPDLRDRGFAISKLVAISSLGLVSWLATISGISSPTTELLVTITLIFIGSSTYFYFRNRNQIFNFFRREWKLILITELIFLIILSIFAFFKFNDPSINHTEQPMDLAFLNAAMVTEPGGPLDPWMKGESISYYYFGYWLFGNLGSLINTAPEVTYNLSLILIPALMGSAVFGLACSLLPSVIQFRSILSVGIISSISVVFLSNLYGGLSFIAQNRMANSAFWDRICVEGLSSSSVNIVDSWRPTEFWWWFKSSRIINFFGESCGERGIDYTINEFPFFSYLLGDLHPHMMGGPFLIMFCTLCLGAAYKGAPSNLNKPTLSLILLIAIAVATVTFVNMWSIPVIIVILVFIYLLRWVSGFERSILNAMFVPLSSFLLAALFLSPFLYQFRSSITGLQPSIVQTSLVHFLIAWGPLLIFVVPYILSQFWTTPISIRWKRSLFIASAVSFSPWVIRGFLSDGINTDGPGFVGVAIPITGLIFISTTTALSKIQISGLTRQSLVLLLINLGLLLILIPELFFVGDIYGNRMNTVFKFYYQAWIFLAASTGIVVHFWASKYYIGKNKNRWGLRIWGILTVIIFLVGIYYVPAAIATKMSESNFKSFDGLVFIDVRGGNTRDAIRYVRSTVSKTDGILEAVGEWGDAGIISMNSGVPNIINWPGHQKQWRPNDLTIEQRVADVKTIYETIDIDLARKLLDKYQVKYVVVGPKESQIYGSSGLLKFENMGVKVFGSQPNIEIYKLRQ